MATSVHEVCNAMTFSSNFNVEKCCADKNLWIETVKAEANKVVMHGFLSDHQDGSYAVRNNFPLPSFRYQTANAILIGPSSSNLKLQNYD